MNELKIKKLNLKSSISAIASVVSFIGCVIFGIASSAYSSAAENEKMNDPVYREEVKKREEEERKLAAQRAEADRQRYLYLQEKQKADAENRRLQKERDKKDEALREISGILDDADRDMDDYERVDAAYKVLTIMKDGGFDEQVKYRALSCISALAKHSEERKTERKIEGIGDEIESL